MSLKERDHCWIGAGTLKIREIPSQFSRGVGGDKSLVDGCRLALPLVAEKEEEPVPTVQPLAQRNGAANHPSKLIALEHLARISQFIVDVVVGVECVIPEVFKKGFVQAVCSRLFDPLFCC